MIIDATLLRITADLFVNLAAGWIGAAVIVPAGSRRPQSSSPLYRTGQLVNCLAVSVDCLYAGKADISYEVQSQTIGSRRYHYAGQPDRDAVVDRSSLALHRIPVDGRLRSSGFPSFRQPTAIFRP